MGMTTADILYWLEQYLISKPVDSGTEEKKMAIETYVSELRSFDYSLQSALDTIIKAARDCFIDEDALSTVATIIVTARYNLACELQEVKAEEESEDYNEECQADIGSPSVARFCE